MHQLGMVEVGILRVESQGHTRVVVGLGIGEVEVHIPVEAAEDIPVVVVVGWDNPVVVVGWGTPAVVGNPVVVGIPVVAEAVVGTSFLTF